MVARLLGLAPGLETLIPSDRRIPDPKIVAMEDSSANRAIVTIVDSHGRPWDPGSGNPLDDGQEEPGSIFYVPPSEITRPYQLFTANDTTTPITELIEQMNLSSGVNIFLHVTPRPEDRDRIPPPPPTQFNPRDDIVERSFGSIYRTKCNYCWAVVNGQERERGFKLSEICLAAEKGCSTCNVLQHGIKEFADMMFPAYNAEKVRVRQQDSGRSKLLSDTKTVSLCFDEYEGETIKLTFSGSVDGPEDGEFDKTWDNRLLDTSSYATITLIKEWVKKCSEEHPHCAIPPVSILPLRVLEVSNCRAKLIETRGMVAPYITLSHCWGLKPIIRLVKSNMELMKKGIEWSSLSKTFQDTILITWKLGFRYVWIDALCILQDSVEDWEHHASRMAKIFSDSQLTISAASARDGSKGCFSSRLEEPYVLHSYDSREIRNPRLWMPKQLEGTDRDGCHRKYTVRLKTPHGLYLNRRPKEPLLKRAWVFQEQVLSPRIIHFASGELYFECKSHLACECSGWSSRSKSHQWETRWRKSHTALLDQGVETSQTPGPDQLTRKRHHFEAYRALIVTYTELDITNELDRLPALSGITFGRKDEYLAGIWRSLLIESLHWYPVSKSLRGVMARRPFQYRAPSWSWASIEAPIQYLEKGFYKDKFSTKCIAEVLDASVTPVGLDPRGRVSSGYLRIRGPMGEARVTSVQVTEREGTSVEKFRKEMAEIDPEFVDPSISYLEQNTDLATAATLQRGSKQGFCYLDVPLALGRSEPVEVLPGEEVTCLVISSSTILILRPSADNPGFYTRVGIFKPENEEDWEFETRKESIVIV